jgi:hypothetical protein
MTCCKNFVAYFSIACIARAIFFISRGQDVRTVVVTWLLLKYSSSSYHVLSI